MNVKEFFDEVDPEDLEKAMVCGITKYGSYFVAMPNEITLKELRQFRRMINQNISDLKDERSRAVE